MSDALHERQLALELLHGTGLSDEALAIIEAVLDEKYCPTGGNGFEIYEDGFWIPKEPMKDSEILSIEQVGYPEGGGSDGLGKSKGGDEG